MIGQKWVNKFSEYNCTLLKIKQINKARNGFPGDHTYVREYYSKGFFFISGICMENASHTVVSHFLEQIPQSREKN